MTQTNQDTGRQGETAAVNYLHKIGYRILKQNYHTHWGEIDIIAIKNKTVTFVEVKARVGTALGKPYEAVNKYKIQRLMRPIKLYLLQNNYKDYKLSLDVISIVLNVDHTIKEFKHFINVNN